MVKRIQDSIYENKHVGKKADEESEIGSPGEMKRVCRICLEEELEM